MNIYDLAIIGGGPAGLMAAGRAAELGLRVLLLEKNKQLGVKLLMTGGSRCNFTNQLSPRPLAEKYGPSAAWLLSLFSRFGPSDTIGLFKSLGLESSLEDKGRVFPKSNRAGDVLQALEDYACSGKTEIRLMSPVANILSEKGLISSLILQDGTEVKATNFLIATGGQSYPFSGSSGDAFTWLRDLGHNIINPRAALSPIIVQENIQELEGLSITEAELSLYKGNKKLGGENGDFIFTSVGLSGPAALNLSRLIARQESGDLKIRINFFPEDNQESLEQKLLTLIADNKRLDLVNIFSRLLPRRLAIFLSAQTAIDEHKKGSELTRLERQACLHWLQNYRLSFARLKGFAEAMITVGGIDLKEVDARTMASKLFPNLYLAGEILDADGPTGGYNLQLAWSSAYLAGESIARKMAAL